MFWDNIREAVSPADSIQRGVWTLQPKCYASNQSLGRWCGNMRTAYNKIQKGMKPNCILSQGRIECLEEIGFQWKL